MRHVPRTAFRSTVHYESDLVSAICDVYVLPPVPAIVFRLLLPHCTQLTLSLVVNPGLTLAALYLLCHLLAFDMLPPVPSRATHALLPLFVGLLLVCISPSSMWISQASAQCQPQSHSSVTNSIRVRAHNVMVSAWVCVRLRALTACCDRCWCATQP